jgi:uncharacterized protein YvpB
MVVGSFFGLSAYGSVSARVVTEAPVTPNHIATPLPFITTNLTTITKRDIAEILEPLSDNEVEFTEAKPVEEKKTKTKSHTSTPTAKPKSVPFYSQFTDITSPQWQKVGCGIASVAMLIDYYSDEAVSVDDLLTSGIESGAFNEEAGWSHAGLIALAKPYGISGDSHSLAHLSTEDAMNALAIILKDGPVMASVHYTFEPTNPIPHLVVITGTKDDRVYYNDPAETSGNNSITVEKFTNAWKKRYIEIRPL